MVVFRAADGTEFKDRAEYRKYLFLTQYTFKDRQGEVLVKLPGEIEGQPFDLTALSNCEVKLLDHSEAIHADELTDCRVFIAACADSVFVRNCSGCKFTVACKQLRTRDCIDCEFRLYCKTEPIIETSTGMAFAPFNGAYAGHSDHLKAAGLTTPNLWFGVYDFNDEAKTGKNWRLVLPPEDEGPPWRPLDDASEVVIPKTLPGSIPLPSKQTGSGFGGGSFEGAVSGGGDGNQGSTMAFSFSTSASEAAALMKNNGSHSSPPSTTVTEEKSRQGDGSVNDSPEAPVVPCNKKATIGWDPSRFRGGEMPLPVSPSSSSNAPVSPPPHPEDCCDGDKEDKSSLRVQLIGECCSQSSSSLTSPFPSKGLLAEEEEEEESDRLDARNTDQGVRDEVTPLLALPPLPPMPQPAEEETDAFVGTSFVRDSTTVRTAAQDSGVSTAREGQHSLTPHRDSPSRERAQDAADVVSSSPLRRAAVQAEQCWRSEESSTGKEAVMKGAMGESSVRGIRGEVPLQLRAILLYASEQRGVDLAKWFCPSRGRSDDYDGKGEHRSGGSSDDVDDRGDKEGRPARLTVAQFELLLMGLMEGLKAGLTNEEREEIDAAVAPETIQAAAEAAAEEEDVPSESARCGNSRSSARVDVLKLFDLCGICRTRGGTTEGGGEGMGRNGREHEGGFHIKEAGKEEKMIAEDEHALRRVAQQDDLFKGLLHSLGLRKPVDSAGVTNSSVSTAAWKGSLKNYAVSLEAFQQGLKDVGLPLSRARAEALANYGCGPLIASIQLTPHQKRRPRRARQSRNGAVSNKNDRAFGGVHDGSMDKKRIVLFLSAWGLRSYLLRLRVEPKSVEARGKILRRFDCRDVGRGNESGDRLRNINSSSGSCRSETAASRPIEFEAWSLKQRGYRVAREKKKEREFQKALAGQVHSLGPQELDDCIRRFDIIPPEVLARELQAMARAFLESVEGRRRVREVVKRWDKVSP